MARSDLELAGDPSTPVERLRRLTQRSSSWDHPVRAAVAANPNAPPDLIWELSRTHPGEVLHNPSFELLSLEDPLWLSRPQVHLVFALMNHPRAPEWFVEQVLSGPPSVRAHVASQTDRSDLLWRLIRKNPTDSEMLKAVVNNGHSSAALLEHLAAECDMVVPVLERWRSPAHPYFVGAALESRPEGMTPEQEATLVRNPKVPVRELERLSTSPHELVRSAVASSPAAPAALLVRLARDPSVQVREQVALNEACPHALAGKLRRELGP